MPVGPASLTIVIGTPVAFGPSTSWGVAIVPSAPSLFAAYVNQSGPALAQNIIAGAPPSSNQLTNPALPGGFITLWGTGLGNSTTADVSVEVAGQRVPATFAGRAPSLPGVDQINFQLPQNAYTGCYVPVQLRVKGQASNPVTLAINPTPGACAHPLGLTYHDLQTLDQGGQIPFGQISVLFTDAVPPYTSSPQGGISAAFSKADAAGIFGLSGPQTPAAFGCGTVDTDVSRAVSTLAIDISGLYDAGTQLSLSSSAGVQLTVLPRSQGGYAPGNYSSGGTWIQSAGSYQITGTGGIDIGAFQQTFTLPPPPKLMNEDSFRTLSSSSDVAVTWDPRGYSPSDVMSVSVDKRYFGFPNLQIYPIVGCSAPASSGQIMIPRALIDMYGYGALGADSLFLGTFARIRSSVPMASGQTIPLVLDYSLGQLTNYP
jgi:hypothetical protein